MEMVYDLLWCCGVVWCGPPFHRDDIGHSYTWPGTIDTLLTCQLVSVTSANIVLSAVIMESHRQINIWFTIKNKLLTT